MNSFKINASSTESKAKRRSITVAILIVFLMIFGSIQAQQLPVDYFKPKLGGAPKSDFYALFYYDLGYTYSDEFENIADGLGFDGFKSLVFFPSSKRKGYELSFGYAKAIQNAYLNDEVEGPMLGKAIDLQAKIIGKNGVGFSTLYKSKKYEMDKEEYLFNGVGLEMSFGGYPTLNYLKGNWPVSFKMGYIISLQDVFDDPVGLVYGELALQRIRKRAGVSFYASFYVRAEYQNYYIWTDIKQDDYYYYNLDFGAFYLMQGFRFGFML